MGKKNLQVCRLEVDRLVNGKILIRQTVRVCSRSFPGYFRVSEKFKSRKIKPYDKAYYKYPRLYMSFWGKEDWVNKTI